MAEGNGSQPTLDTIEQAIEYQRSVKKDDYVKSGTFNFVFPAFGFYNWTNQYTALPPALPAYDRYAFASPRDKILLSAHKYEAMWASAVAIATTQMAASGWEVDSDIPLRRKRVHQLYQTATVGSFWGWIPFVFALVRSYLGVGLAFVELERETTSYLSRITGLHHLNPLRCRVTDNPQKPVEYLDRHGKIHALNYYDVLVFGDQVDPTEGEIDIAESATCRAYPKIIEMEAVSRYLYEKVTGKRALSIEFIQGITSKTLEDSIRSSDADMERKGSTLYKGIVAVPIPGDVPINRVSIPIAEVPDAFKYQEIWDNDVIVYSDAIGLDVNDVDPRLAQRLALGSGAQSVVLANKAKGKGLAAFKQDWILKNNILVTDSATTFAFSETSVEDELKKAQLQYQRAQTRDLQIKANMISNLEARNLEVDDGDLPPEFLQQDMTQGGVLTSEDKPTPPQEEGMTTAPPPLMMPRTPQEVAEEQQQRFDAQREDAKKLQQSGNNALQNGKKPQKVAGKELKRPSMRDVLQEEMEKTLTTN